MSTPPTVLMGYDTLYFYLLHLRTSQILVAPPLDPSLYLALGAGFVSQSDGVSLLALCMPGVCYICRQFVSAVAGRPCVAATGQSAGCLDSYLIPQITAARPEAGNARLLICCCRA